MILQKIELCPFAGFQHRLVEFNRGLNVVEGENEAGKSTLVNAIKAVLFENTTQGKRALTEFSDKYFPRGKSDHAKVILTFACDGNTYTLTKIWGAGSSAHLISSDGSTWNDDQSVQVQMNKLLKVNRGSWETILFADQNTLFETADRIQKNADNIDRIPTLKNMGGGIPGDIPADDLLADLEASIDTYTGQWDFGANGPKDNRGIQNKWSKSVGLIIKAYYEMEDTRHKYEQLNSYELDMESASAEFKTRSAEKIVVQADLKKYNAFKEAVSEQNRIKLALSEAKNLLDPMLVAMQEWKSKADNQIVFAETLHELSKSMDTLLAEGKLAARLDETRQSMAQYARIQGLDRRIAETQQNLTNNGSISKSDIEQIEKLMQAINKCQVSLEAQKLQATISATQTTELQIQGGIEAETTVTVQAGGTEIVEAAGQLTFKADGFSVVVKSLLEPVDELIAKLSKNQAELTAILDRYSLPSAQEYERRLLLNQTENRQLENLNQQRKEALDLAKMDFEALKTLAIEIEAIPSTTREVNVVRDLYREEKEKHKSLTETKEKDAVFLKIWTNNYADATNLAIMVGGKSLEVQQLEKQLSALSGLPPEFKSEQEFREHIAALDGRLNTLTEQLGDLERTMTRLQTLLENFDSDALSLQAKLENDEARFQRTLSEYNALRLAQTKLKAMIDAQQDNPFEAFETETARIFGQITDQRYTQIVREGEVPAGVMFKDQMIPVELLSGGTAGSLGLAVRLAYANQYLDGLDGFLVLDDPFTDFDEGRRKGASQFLQDFAQQKQVFVMTCHSEHAADLGGHRIELKKTT